MKIGIITFHRADNYGALLQAYALQEKLCNMGHDTQIIDYRCKGLEKDYLWFYRPFPKPTRNIKAWFFELKRRIPCLPMLHKKRDKCSAFRNRFLKMSRSVESNFDKEEIEKEFDLIFTGSDQIWNWFLTHGADRWYAYSRILSYEKIVVASYGASIGNMDRFINHLEEYRSALDQYDFISTREDTAKEYLENHLKKKIYKVLDPTLLMNSDFWMQLVNSDTLVERPFILLYGVVHDDLACNYADKLKKQTGNLLVHFEQELKKYSDSYYAQGSGPEDLINYIAKAEYVVTSSFHGTVFSILLHKKFVSIPHPANDPRIVSLLTSLNLKDRIVNRIEDYSMIKINAPIDYNNVDNLLIKLQADSNEFIDKCIKCAEGKIEKIIQGNKQL